MPLQPGQVPAAFIALCPGGATGILPNGTRFIPANCTGNTCAGGCNNTGSQLDGICISVEGDSSETCLQNPV